MSVTITFHRISEKKPKHLEDIIWLRNTSCFDSFELEPRSIQAVYQWIGVDEDGYCTGNDFIYESIEDIEYFDNTDSVQLGILFDGYRARDDDLWISLEDYWKCFEEG